LNILFTKVIDDAPPPAAARARSASRGQIEARPARSSGEEADWRSARGIRLIEPGA
jgi:hypothetical protein